jgi:hypothetical protein
MSDRIAPIATALTGALVISTVSLGAAVGPVRAAQPGHSWTTAVPLGAAGAGDRAGA